MASPNPRIEEIQLLQDADHLRIQISGNTAYPAGASVNLSDGTVLMYEEPSLNSPEKITNHDMSGTTLITIWAEPLGTTPSESRPGRQVMIGAIAVDGYFHAIRIEERNHHIVATAYNSNHPSYLQAVTGEARTNNPMQPQDLDHQRALFELAKKHTQIRADLLQSLGRLASLI